MINFIYSICIVILFCSSAIAENVPSCSKATIDKAKKGDNKAQYELARMLFKGECSNGTDTFEKWLVASAEQGNVEAAQGLWGIFYNISKDKKHYELALKYLTASMQKGDNKAKDFLSCINKTTSLTEKAKSEDVVSWFEYGELLADEPNNQCSANASEGFVWLNKAAERGYIPAYRELGRLYLLGRGIEQNMQLAVYNLTEAAQKGDVQAMEMLAHRYEEKDPKEAFKWYSAAAMKGSTEAQYSVGTMYLSGKGTGVDKKEGVSWLKKSASENLYAKATLADMYLNGDGVTKDCSEATKYYTLTAKTDSEIDYEIIIEAMKKLGLIYSHNPYKVNEIQTKNITDGCTSYDVNQAESWYLKAIKYIDDTCNYFKKIDANTLAKSLSGKKDMIKLSLTSVYLNERLNPGKGISILKELADKYDSMRGYYLTRIALAYYLGQAGPVDYKEAIKWFTKAALEGDYGAQDTLSSMYGLGKGVKKDIVTAYAWSSVAHANGGGSDMNEITVELEKTMKPQQIQQAQTKAKKLWKEIETNKEKQAKKAAK